MNLKVYNIDHGAHVLPGGLGMPFDRAIVVDEAQQEAHILTGKLQPVTVYRGDLAGAHAFVKEQEGR